MRDVINKGVTEEDLMNAVGAAFESGWNSVKLYFMIGLPYELMRMYWRLLIWHARYSINISRLPVSVAVRLL